MADLRPNRARGKVGAHSEDEGEHAEREPQQPQRPERELIERAQQGDHQAFEILLRRYQRRVLSLIARLVSRPAEVEDVAQQVFLKVYLALPRFDFRAAFSTWLYRVAVNECYDHLRRQRAQKSPGGSEISVGELEELDRLAARPSRPADDPLRRLELRQTVEQLLRRLSPEDRVLLTLKEMEGFSTREIADLLKLKENTVKVRLFRVRKRLLEIHRRLRKREGGRGA